MVDMLIQNGTSRVGLKYIHRLLLVLVILRCVLVSNNALWTMIVLNHLPRRSVSGLDRRLRCLPYVGPGVLGVVKGNLLALRA